MTKEQGRPADIPEEVWAKALQCSSIMATHYLAHVELIARAILAAKVEERSIFTDAGRDNDALNSAVGVLRTQQAQPHKSTQSILWEAIQDYAERAKVSTAHKNSEVQ